VSGVNPSIPSLCVNTTGLPVAFITDAALSGVTRAMATAASSSSAARTASSSSTSSAASPQTSKSASASAISGYAAECLFRGVVVVLGPLIAASAL
jgi:hypothetical protein